MTRDHYKGVVRSAENVKVVNSVVGDGAHRDAGDRFRITSPFTIFQSTHENGKNPLSWDETLTGAATSVFTVNESSIKLGVTTASGDSAIRQSKRYLKYQPGKSLNVVLTGAFATGDENRNQKIGYFDSENGAFFAMEGTTVGVTLRSFVTGSAVDTFVPQKQWNIDRLDGTGLSGVILKPEKSQIFFIDLQWLGVGRVRMGFYFGGQIYYCHEFINDNINSTSYMTTATLPCRYELENTGTATTSGTLTQICSTVYIEGGENPKGIVRGIDNGAAGKSISLNDYNPLLTIRLKNEFSKSSIIPLSYQAFVTSNDNVRINLVLNGNLSGGSFLPVDTGSITEYNTTATSISGGTVIWSSYTSNDFSGNLYSYNETESSLVLSSTISGTLDTLTLVVQPIGAGSATVRGSLNFKELY